MAIADRFLEDARIGIQVEVVAGPKEITGEIVALDKETVSIHRKDNRTSTLLISSISYYEIIEDEKPAEPALGKEPSKEPSVKTEPEPAAKAEPVQQAAAATAVSGNTPPQSLFEKQLSGVFAPSDEVYKLCLSAVDDLKYRDAIKVLSDALPDMQDKKAECEALIQFLTEAAERAEEERIVNDGTDLYKGIIISKAEMDPDKASYYLRRAVEKGGPRLKTAIYRSLVVYFKAGDVEKAADVAEELIERTRQVVPEEDQTIIWKTMLNLFSATGRQKIYEKTLFDLIHASQSHIVACINATLKFVAPLEDEGDPETAMEVYRTILDIKEVQESEELLTQIFARLVLFLHKTDQGKSVKELAAPFLSTEEARRAYNLTIEPVLEKLLETGDVSVCEIDPDELVSEDSTAGDEKNRLRRAQIEQRYEEKFKSFRENKDSAGARKWIADLVKSAPDNRAIEAIAVRAELYTAQLKSYAYSKAEVSPAYLKAMSSWLDNGDLEDAEGFFMEDAVSESTSKGMSILAYIDMLAVEHGFEAAEKHFNELGQEIRLCDRSIRTAFHEKKYRFAALIDHNDIALEALNALRNLYYNKSKLGSVAFRAGDCYLKKSNWKQALSQFEKATENGYSPTSCEKKIHLCRIKLGEIADDTAQKDSAVDTVIATDKGINMDVVRSRIEELFAAINYSEADRYINQLKIEYPDNEELRDLQDETSAALQRYNLLGQTLPKGKDNQGFALRAWRIENNSEKAKRFFLSEIESKGPKWYACLMDYAEMVMHVSGAQEAVKELRSYESWLSFVPDNDHSGYYEKLFLLQKKADDKEGMIDSLQKLLKFYSRAKNQKKVIYTNARIGQTYYAMKQYEQAIEAMMEIPAESRTNANYTYIVMSYANLGDESRIESFLNGLVEADPSNQEMVSSLREQVKEQVAILSSYKADSGITEEFQDGDGDPEAAESYMISINTPFDDYFLEKYSGNPVGLSALEVEQKDYTEKDVRRVREGIQKESTQGGKAGRYGTLAVLEHELNGESSQYYKNLRMCALHASLDYLGKSMYESALACRIYKMEIQKNVTTGKDDNERIRDAEIYLESLTGKRGSRIQDDSDEAAHRQFILDLMNRALEGETTGDPERGLMKMALLIDKSDLIKDLIRSMEREKRQYLIGKIMGMIAPDRETADCETFFECIRETISIQENRLRMFSNRIKNSKVFKEEHLNEIRDFKECIIVFDTDQIYLNALISAYEHGIELNVYNDYESIMAVTGTVEKQLADIQNQLMSAPTYFGVNFLEDIINNLLEVLRERANTVREELQPDITINVAITDIPVIDERQNIDVTVYNKENAANARDIRLSILDARGNLLMEEQTVASYMRAGREQGISRECSIPTQGELYTITIQVSYMTPAGNRCVKTSDFSISTGEDEFQDITNPYYAGDAIDVKDRNVFVGRDSLLDSISSALCDDRSSCEIIYGQKRCGKSSIANFLEERLKDRFMIIKFSIGAARTPQSIYRNVKDKLIDMVEDLSEQPGSGIGEDMIDYLDDISIADDEEFVSFMRVVRRKLCRPLGKELLIMIDEFTHLYRLVDDNRPMVLAFMDTWKKIMEEKLFKALLIGQDTMPNFIREFQNQFRVTQPRRVDMLDDESAKQLIVDPIRLPDGRSRYVEGSEQLIADWFHGQPYYIQLYCRRMVDQMNVDHRVLVSKALAEKVKQAMLEEENEDLFDNLISKGDESGTERECFDILKQIASLSKNSEWASIKDIEIEGKEELIQDLINRAVIVKHGDKCRILISFFKEWLNLQ
ncbi:MAG: hypothetical protein E7307_04310 [Butyrivibrio sp.]|nr:hypothetical protein [Butyrivibrio sp.]